MLHLFGDLVLDSSFPLPLLPLATGGTAECRFTVSPDHGRDTTIWDHHWRRADGAISLSCAREGTNYRLGVPGLATFSIRHDGAAITAHPHPSLAASTLTHLLVDQVLPRVLSLRGRLVLHAACVATPAGAVAFLGESGAGKSTLSACFARAGHPLLGDDGAVIHLPDRGPTTAMATYPGLRLLPEARARVYGGDCETSPVADDSPKHRILGVEHVEGPLAVERVYLLAPPGDDAGRIAIEAVSPLDGFVAVLRAIFQLHLDDAPRARALFRRVASLIERVPVRRLSYPREMGRLDEVRDAVLRDLAAPQREVAPGRAIDSIHAPAPSTASAAWNPRPASRSWSRHGPTASPTVENDRSG